MYMKITTLLLLCLPLYLAVIQAQSGATGPSSHEHREAHGANGPSGK